MFDEKPEIIEETGLTVKQQAEYNRLLSEWGKLNTEARGEFMDNFMLFYDYWRQDPGVTVRRSGGE